MKQFLNDGDQVFSFQVFHFYEDDSMLHLRDDKGIQIDQQLKTIITIIMRDIVRSTGTIYT